MQPLLEAIPGVETGVGPLRLVPSECGFCRQPSMQFCGPLCAQSQTLRSFSGLLLLLDQCAALVDQATPPLRRNQQALYMVRGPGRALRARQRLPGHNQGCLCCAPPQSRSAWRFDPDALKKSGDDDDDGT